MQVNPFGLGLFIGFVIGFAVAAYAIFRLAARSGGCECPCARCGKEV